MILKKKIKKHSENKNLKLHTYIESGIFKGKKLLLPSLSTTRSTKSIVKACVFNVLRMHLKDKIFIEAFGGSALMAAQALSEGCFKALAIELDDEAFKIALKNAKSLNANLELYKGDTFKLLEAILAGLSKESILYFDPPFDFREGFDGIYEKIYSLLESLDLRLCSHIVLEHYSQVKTPETLHDFKRIKLKRFGTTSLSFYENLKTYKTF